MVDGGSSSAAYGWHIVPNQTAPLDRLVGNQTVYSVDLKSATDRWPYLFLDACFGPTFADAVSQILALSL